MLINTSAKTAQINVERLADYPDLHTNEWRLYKVHIIIIIKERYVPYINSRGNGMMGRPVWKNQGQGDEKRGIVRAYITNMILAPSTP